VLQSSSALLMSLRIDFGCCGRAKKLNNRHVSCAHYGSREKHGIAHVSPYMARDSWEPKSWCISSSFYENGSEFDNQHIPRKLRMHRIDTF
jgi:hypothetical protein